MRRLSAPPPRTALEFTPRLVPYVTSLDERDDAAKGGKKASGSGVVGARVEGSTPVMMKKKKKEEVSHGIEDRGGGAGCGEDLCSSRSISTGGGSVGVGAREQGNEGRGDRDTNADEVEAEGKKRAQEQGKTEGKREEKKENEELDDERRRVLLSVPFE